MLERTVNTAVSGQLCRVKLLCTPDSTHPLFQTLSSHYSVELAIQRGVDLGQRMYNAASEALATYKQVVLIGCDCLQLTRINLNNVLNSLVQDQYDAVVTPALDGGYVLLGLKRVNRALFEHIEWGTDQVMQQTRSALQALQWQYQECEPLQDLDTIDDIKNLLQKHRHQLDAGVCEMLDSLTKETQE